MNFPIKGASNQGVTVSIASAELKARVLSLRQKGKTLHSGDVPSLAGPGDPSCRMRIGSSMGLNLRLPPPQTSPSFLAKAGIRYAPASGSMAAFFGIPI
jgi:hypothetical protein